MLLIWVSTKNYRLQPSFFLFNWLIRGCYFQEGAEVKIEMKVEHAYRRSVETVVKWIHNEVNTSKTQVFFRTFAPVHFRFVSILSVSSTDFLELCMFDSFNTQELCTVLDCYVSRPSKILKSCNWIEHQIQTHTSSWAMHSLFEFAGIFTSVGLCQDSPYCSTMQAC